jgi:hypothetical protein
MSVLRWLGLGSRGGRPAGEGAPAEAWTGLLDDTPVHGLLDGIGVPWRATRAELAARYGVVTHPAYEWPVIPFPTQPPLVDGLIYPLSAQAFPSLSPRAPATAFSAVVSLGDSVRRNIESPLAQLVPRLGEQRVGRQHNTLRAEWRFGRASLTLTAWPPELQSFRGGNPSHDRDPRLVTACHIQIETGWRPPLDAREQAQVDSFVEIARVEPADTFPPAERRFGAAPSTELEFIREPSQDDGGRWGLIGRSADGEAVILWRRFLYLLPRAELAGLAVEYAAPARGAGGLWLHAEMRTGDPEDPAKRIFLASGGTGDPYALDRLARQLAGALDVPLTYDEPYQDV